MNHRVYLNGHSNLIMVLSINQGGQIDQFSSEVSLLAFEEVGQLSHIQHLETPVVKFA